MDRFVLTDAQWAKMAPLCLGKASDPGRSGGDNRLFLEAVLWIARTGSPWRDLPPSFGKWNTVFKRYRDWVEADVFKRIFDAASEDPDMAFAMVDVEPLERHWSERQWRGIVKVHRPPLGDCLQSPRGGKSKGGMTTKILALTDALGNLVE